MFAYCNNNPANGADPNGLFVEGLAASQSRTYEDRHGAGLLFVALMAFATIAYQENSSQGTYELKNAVRKGDGNIYTVYFLMDNTGEVRYVGRVKTANFDARMEFHKHTRHLLLHHRVDGLSYEVARAYEEVGMISYNTHTKEFPGNIIHGIGPNNPKASLYYFDFANYIENKLSQCFFSLMP